MSLEYEVILDRDRTFAFQQTNYGLFLLQGFLTCRERDTLSTQGIRFNVIILTGHGYVLPAQPNGRSTVARVLIPVGRRPRVTIFLFPSHLEDMCENAEKYKTGKDNKYFKNLNYINKLGHNKVPEISDNILL